MPSAIGLHTKTGLYWVLRNAGISNIAKLYSQYLVTLLLFFRKLCYSWIQLMEGSHSGLVRAPAKRLGRVNRPRGFESRSLRQECL